MSEGATEPEDGTSPRDLLREVVDIESVSGDEERAAQRLVSYFEEHGREAWTDEVGNVRAPGDDALLLTSHVDTVPGDIPVRVEDGVLYGRGSVDAKGPLCAMAVAAVRTGASFVGVVGEETDSRGARHLVEDRDPPEALINGEPSGWDGVTLGYRGMLAGRYVTTSESGHSSRPEPNAIQTAIDWWERVEDAFAGDEYATVTEQVTPKPLSFDGGLTEDGLAVEATVDAQFRVPVDSSVDDVRETVQTCIEDGSVSWKDAIPPVLVDQRNELATAFRGAIRRADGSPSLYVKTGTADVNLYHEAWDCPMVTYGPGDSDLDHTPNEHLALDEFDRAVDVLVDVAERQVG